MKAIYEKIRKTGIIPVIVLDDAAKADKVAKALIDGGIACAEVTFRTEAAEEAIRSIASSCPQMLLGAGTVLTTEHTTHRLGLHGNSVDKDA